MRWTPAKSVSATVDTMPGNITFTASTVTTPGQTVTSNAVTVLGITQPITISVSGGTNAKYSKNGGAYTSAAGTVTNGDTIILQADSPAAGVEQVVTLNAGSSNFTWKVRTAGNNTIRIFTRNSSSSGFIGSVGSADSACTSSANAAGLPGSWVAVISASANEKIIDRLPWNWQTLKNMNGQTVATSIDDFIDGSVSAPMNYNETGATTASSSVWTGLDATGTGTSSGTPNCYSWTSGSNSYYARNGDSASTSSGSYFYTGTSPCGWGLRLLCMETNQAGADTDPDAVVIPPKVVFTSGGIATSNTITITGVTDEVDVQISPASGSANIIKGGVSVGATTTTAGLNETLQFTLTAPTTLGTKNTAIITIGSDTYDWWVGYADSAKVAHAFALSRSNAAMGGLTGADSICSTAAATSSYGLTGSWKAIMSDSSINAADRIPWNWGTLRTVNDAVTIVDGGYPDLFDGSLDMPMGYDVEGNVLPNGNVYTGSNYYGISYSSIGSSNMNFCSDWTSSGSTPNAAVGSSSSTTSTWLYSSSYYYACYNTSYIYCIEDVDNSTDTTPNQLTVPYAIQVPTSSRQTSASLTIGGMSSGATQTISVSGSSGTPKVKINGGAEVSSGTITNGDTVAFVMDAPASGNSSNKMTITAGSMTTYWRVWTGDTTGTAVKRVFVTTPTSNSTNRGGVTSFDSDCNTRASAAGLGGTWVAIMSGQGDDETQWAVNRIGYDWSTLRRVDGVDVVLAGNIWSTATANLLNPISKDQTGATVSSTYVKTGTDVYGLAATKTSAGQCVGWTSSSTSDAYNGSSGLTSSMWINNGSTNNPGAYSSCHYYAMSSNYIYCIEQ